MYKFIDLFAGVGGFHFAFKGNAKCVFASEWDNNARKTYLANWGDELKENDAVFAGDITSVNYSEIPDFDILCGGFPCQPFSIAGKQLGFSHATQGTLFFNILELIKIKNPRVVFLENVKNLASHDKGNTFKTILGALEEAGYKVKYEILNGTTHGNTPQNRERIFIVGFLNQTDYDNFNFPEKIELNKHLFSCLEQGKVSEKYYQNNLESPSVQKMVDGITKKGIIYQYRRYYMRENKGGVCPTLTANMGTGGHNVPLIMDDFGIRKLTPRECFNFQGFPSSFIIPENIAASSLYKQAGNSVTVPVIKRISDKILEALKKTDG